ncbi:Fumarate hydratase 1, mitochondrial [Musa troglodytarum]|uniref:Fumarate hydratase 1, mitochondrial n=1 Tax=Musa troglodytarum TaxID=320322 RepID=A0A9E7KU95_9LILI|nr:Fumarate hydratase 1, mitochondrial [Musa troglodytarum]
MYRKLWGAQTQRSFAGACLRLLGDASASFEKNCVRGIKANHQKISKLSHQEAALNLNMFTAEEFDELVYHQRIGLRAPNMGLFKEFVIVTVVYILAE